MTAVLIRMMLIAALLAWSPAWCCCALRNLAVENSSGTASSPALPSADAPTRACCAAKALADTSERGPSPCRCHDRPDELTRLDTSLKITVPIFERVTLPAIFRPDIRISAPVNISCAICAWMLDRDRHPPAAATLVDQHVLLLT